MNMMISDWPEVRFQNFVLKIISFCSEISQRVYADRILACPGIIFIYICQCLLLLFSKSSRISPSRKYAGLILFLSESDRFQSYAYVQDYLFLCLKILSKWDERSFRGEH